MWTAPLRFERMKYVHIRNATIPAVVDEWNIVYKDKHIYMSTMQTNGTDK